MLSFPEITPPKSEWPIIHGWRANGPNRSQKNVSVTLTRLSPIDIRCLILTAKSQNEDPRTSLGKSHSQVGKRRRNLLQAAHSRRAIRKVSAFFGLFLLVESGRQRRLCITSMWNKSCCYIFPSRPPLLCFINSRFQLALHALIFLEFIMRTQNLAILFSHKRKRKT
jgi:hypothetical protein